MNISRVWSFRVFFVVSQIEHGVKQTFEFSAIWDFITFMWRHFNVICTEEPDPD